ncbi:MAG: hypothetical protein GWN58_01190, partial [Anaerolineae bacterium]|nr:hypothetical protein [Anaerolineae bacterium]
MPEITELFDVDVERVGLVKRGANRKRFFLMKSREDGDMDEKQEALDVLTEIEQVEEGDLEITHVHGLARITKAVVEFLFGNDQEQEEEPQPENDVRTEPEPDPEPAVKAEE